MMSQITKGRKKAPISYLFNDVNKKGMKVDRVTCRYCHIEIAKNGTRMATHIKKCEKTAECLKVKYLGENWKVTEKENINREGRINERCEKEKRKTRLKEVHIQKNRIQEKNLDSFMDNITNSENVSI